MAKQEAKLAGSRAVVKLAAMGITSPTDAWTA